MHRFKVDGMSCGHCVAAVTRELQAADPAARVQVDLALGRVEVDSSLPDERLLAAIAEAGYRAQPVQGD